MVRHRGQVAVVFAGLVVVLLGILGLAIDGGYYWAASRGVTIAADSAARAAAADVQRAQNGGSFALYGRATSDGRAIGQANLAQRSSAWWASRRSACSARGRARRSRAA
ncbi:MAG TPA: pilus assembly protein TadG-related protein [Chloroflexota bacterium]|jgi:uncharacterized membrane protein